MKPASPDLELAPEHELHHEPGADTYWNESWYFDFASADGSLGGYVRVGLYPNLNTVWYWACVVGEGRPLVTVIDHAVPLPGAGSLELSHAGLRADHLCESPGQSWRLTLDAPAISVDDAADVYHSAPGKPVKLRLDLVWTTANAVFPQLDHNRYEVPCRVHGEIGVGGERIDLDGWGERDHSWGVRDWWQLGWCWTAGRLADASAFHAFRVESELIDVFSGFSQAAGKAPVALPDFRFAPELGREGLPSSTAMQFGELSVQCTPLAFAPVLLEAPDGRVSRFPRALCRFDAEDGRRGFGWTEWNQPQPGA